MQRGIHYKCSELAESGLKLFINYEPFLNFHIGFFFSFTGEKWWGRVSVCFTHTPAYIKYIYFRIKIGWATCTYSFICIYVCMYLYVYIYVFSLELSIASYRIEMIWISASIYVACEYNNSAYRSENNVTLKVQYCYWNQWKEQTYSTNVEGAIDPSVIMWIWVSGLGTNIWGKGGIEIFSFQVSIVMLQTL